MDESGSEATTPFWGLMSSQEPGGPLSAFRSVRKPSAPNAVERALGLFHRYTGVQRFRGHRQTSPPGESLSSLIDRWDYEARILEVDGILIAAPHSTP
jgi:hypothetical protein